MLFRREDVERVHPFDTYAASTDNVLKIELAKHTEFVDRPLVLRGDGENRASKSADRVTAMQEIFSKYQYLYSRYDEPLRREALANIYYAKANRFLTDRIWSPTATYYFLKSVVTSPNVDRRPILMSVVSLSGRPGLTLGKKLVAVARNVGRGEVCSGTG
jgi:hypothetical protein